MGLKVLILAGRKTGYNSINYILEKRVHAIIGVFSQDYPTLVNDGISTEDYEKYLFRNNIPFWKTDKIHDNFYVRMVNSYHPILD